MGAFGLSWQLNLLLLIVPGLIMFVLAMGTEFPVTERVAEGVATEELSVGDYVLSGGEPAALVVVDAVVRLLPGAMSDHESAAEDSFYDGLLAPPVFTRPAESRGREVPEVLRSGDHARIAEWRRLEAERLTRDRRPELWEREGH